MVLENWIRTRKNCVAAEVNLPEDRLCLKMAYSILILLLEPYVYTWIEMLLDKPKCTSKRISGANFSLQPLWYKTSVPFPSVIFVKSLKDSKEFIQKVRKYAEGKTVHFSQSSSEVMSFRVVNLLTIFFSEQNGCSIWVTCK